jgi:integrase/recombinase XerD
MIESIFVFESTRARQREAPLLQEREQYLSYMLSEGVSKQRVRTIASMLLHVIRLMELSCLRVVDMAEIQQGSQRWLTDTSHKMRRPGESSVSSFTYTAKNWSRFHGLINTPIATEEPTEVICREFLHYIIVTRRYVPSNDQNIRFHSIPFSELGHDPS